MKGATARLQDIEENLCLITKNGRFDLMEVCTPEDSGLAAAVIAKGGSAVRCGLFSG